MQWQCVICRDVLSTSAQIACGPCGHTFHQSCLQLWLKNSPSCPVCRAKLTARTVRKVFLSSHDTTIEEPESENESSSNRQRIMELESINSRLETEKSALEARVLRHDRNHEKLKSKHTTLTDELKTLKVSLKILHGTSEENVLLKRTVAELQDNMEKTRSYKTVLHGTETEVEELMRAYGPGETSVKQIATYCVLLKRELAATKNEHRVAQQEIVSLRRRLGSQSSKLEENERALENAAIELKKYQDQFYILQEMLENPTESQVASTSKALRRPAGDGDHGPIKRAKRNNSLVNSPKVLTNAHLIGKSRSDSVKMPITATLPGYTKMKITSTLRKPEAPVEASAQDELLVNLMKGKSSVLDRDSIQRKGYNGLGGHSSHIQTSKR